MYFMKSMVMMLLKCLLLASHRYWHPTDILAILSFSPYTRVHVQSWPVSCRSSTHLLPKRTKCIHQWLDVIRVHSNSMWNGSQKQNSISIKFHYQRWLSRRIKQGRGYYVCCVHAYCEFGVALKRTRRRLSFFRRSIFRDAS